MRLDKYLAQLGLVPRRQIKRLLKGGEVLLNSTQVDKPNITIKEGDLLTIHGQEIEVRFSVTLLLHKPQGYISSDIDEGEYSSYKDLLHTCPYSELVHVAGRLDADTEGLLLCTSDGKLTQRIIHPEKHIEKEYFVRTELPLNERMLRMLGEGVLLEDRTKTRPAQAEQCGSHELRLTITEGKYHQVKRMLRAVGNEVVYLRRDRIGPWTLDDLPLGAWKYVEEAGDKR